MFVHAGPERCRYLQLNCGVNATARADAVCCPADPVALQLARVLLQLQHHGPCAAVCLKALTDAARAADTAWSARLLHTQALALAAQEEHLQALNCLRTALAR